MTTLRSVIARLATMVRCAGIVYIVVQVALWHSFYTAAAWRLTAPALAVAWGVTATTCLRRHWPPPSLAGVDTAFYVALAVGAQASVPPGIRDSAFNWLFICMSGQLTVPVWYASGALSLPLALSLPAAYLAGSALRPVTDARALAGSVILLVIIGLVHAAGRRFFYGRAVAADAELAGASQEAERHYAILCRDIERREHERLLHDTVLNTLTALSRPGGTVSGAVPWCRRDVALIEAALAAGETASAAVRPSATLRGEVGGVVADMRARGLIVHLGAEDLGAEDPGAEDPGAEDPGAEDPGAEDPGAADTEAAGDTGQAAVPARVVAAIASAVREALSNVAAHAGTGEAWVSVRCTAAEDDADVPCRLRVVVRDRGAGFDLARADRARLGLRRSITERTADCGGQASVRSAPGRGTEVSLVWPAPGLPAAAPVAGHMAPVAGHMAPVAGHMAPVAGHMAAAEGLPW